MARSLTTANEKVDAIQSFSNFLQLKNFAEKSQKKSSPLLCRSSKMGVFGFARGQYNQSVVEFCGNLSEAEKKKIR